MYVPAHFQADDADALIARLAEARAALLVTIGADATPVAVHAPVLWDPERRLIEGHIARANPQWRTGGGRGLVILSGADAYVSPSWYPSKVEHGKAVPTWNYEAAHLSGPVDWFEDRARLESVVRRLSERHETGRASPWRIEDAPRDYIDAMLRGIVGFALHPEHIKAKCKLSQNKVDADYNGVVAGLERETNAEPGEIAKLMRGLRK